MTELIGLAFSAVAGICFVSGIAVLSSRRRRNSNGWHWQFHIHGRLYFG